MKKNKTMRQSILKLFLLAALVGLASCIVDPTPDPEPGPGDKVPQPATLSFSPKLSGHGDGQTRAYYDDIYEMYKQHFGTPVFSGTDIFGDKTTADPDDNGIGRESDSKISRFRVLVYHNTDNPSTTANEIGTLVEMGGKFWNYVFEWTDSQTPPFEIALATGTYNFVFIANEGTLSDELGDGGASTQNQGTKTSYNATMTALEGLTLSFDPDGTGATAGDIHYDKNIPMVSVYTGVEIRSDNTVKCNDSNGNDQVYPKANDNTDSWPVEMHRSAIRLSFGFQMGAGQYQAWKAYHAVRNEKPMLYISGLRQNSYLISKANDDNTALTSKTPALGTQSNPALTKAEITASPTAVRPGKIFEMPTGNGVYDPGTVWVFFDRLIYPEVNLNTNNNADNGIKAWLNFDYAGEVIRREVAVHAVANDQGALTSAGYSLKSNTWVWVNAVVLTDINYTVRVLPWSTTPVDPTDIIQNNFTADPGEFLFPGTGTTVSLSGRATITSDHEDGWNIAEISNNWIRATNTGDIVTVTVESNSSNMIRTGHVTIESGNLLKKIIVTQLPASGEIVDSADPAGATLYAGAFWKANQYGERLITIPRSSDGEIDGSWAAYVVEGKEWIVLDTKNYIAPASRIGAGNDADFDRNHRVEGFDTGVSGELAENADADAGIDTKIYFRIGLNGEHTPTADEPARYGMILLAYNGDEDNRDPITGAITYKYRRIWVRQGEGPDYLFSKTERPTDANVRFSPYNVAPPADKPFNSDGWVQLDQRTTDGRSGGGAFAAYPSQAGAYFQFSPDASVLRRAWRPGNGAYTGWVTTTQYGFDTATMETCPPGWRRPNYERDGAGNTSIDEPGQSLWQTVPPKRETNTDNSVWGYYADGWFDRKELNSNANTVEGNNAGAAYVGRLFYNTNGSASIFFPVAGNRQDYTTIMTGQVGAYWTTFYGQDGIETTNLTHTIHLDNFKNHATPNGQAYSYSSTAWEITYGMPIRCVKDASADSVGKFSVESEVTLKYDGTTIEAVEVISTTADGFSLGWKVKDADNAYQISYNGGDSWTNYTPNDVIFPTRGTGGTEYVPAALRAIPAKYDNLGNEDKALRATIQTGTPAAPEDLSLMYNGLQNTANSYIVNAHGHYKLPLVYGNAIKDGRDNREAYDPEMPTGNGINTNNFLDQFQGAGGAITGPNIPSADNATLVWMDSPGLVTNVRLVDNNNYLAFDIPKETIVQGNAVVAVRDSGGNILWSWQIWVTPLVKATQAGREYDSAINRNGTGYDFMQWNLGWVEPTTRLYEKRWVKITLVQDVTGETAEVILKQGDLTGLPGNHTIALAGNSTSYQFGRKDPIPGLYVGVTPTPSETEIGRMTWRGQKLDGTNYEMYAYGAPNLTLGDAVKNPSIFPFVHHGFPSWWSPGTVGWRNLWNAYNATLAPLPPAILPDRNVVKTVYDPSPAGFKMPPENAFSGFYTPSGQHGGTPSGTLVAGKGYGLWLDPGDHSKGSALFQFVPAFEFGANPIQTNDTGNYWSADRLDGEYPISDSRHTQNGMLLRLREGSSVSIAYYTIPTGNAVRPIADTAPFVPGVVAPKGVIGYIHNPGGANHHQLTLKGDKSYFATGQADQNSYTVYAAYFKWGSLVALSSQDNGEFTPEDIIAAKGYDNKTDPAAALTAIKNHVATGATMQDKWDNIPYGDPDGRTINAIEPVWPMTNTANIRNGIGDACKHYFGADWAVPSDYAIDDFSGATTPYSFAANGGNANNPGIATFASGAKLPAAGWRTTDGAVAMVSQNVSTQGVDGRYMTTFVFNYNTPHALLFDASRVERNRIQGGFPYGLPIRCVEVPTLDVSPAEFNFPDAAARDTYSGIYATVTVGNVSTWQVEGVSVSETEISGTPSWLTYYQIATGNAQDNLRIEVSENGTNAAQLRTAYIHLSAAGGTLKKTIKVTQSAVRASVPAPKGVIGYYVDPQDGKTKLTIRGDKTLGGEIDNVGVAMFKWGSLVALNSYTPAMTSYDPARDVMVVPRFDFAPSKTASWNGIPYEMTSSWPTADDDVNGIGDPCRFYAGMFPDQFENKIWRTPSKSHYDTWKTDKTVSIIETPATLNSVLWLGNAENPQILPGPGVRGGGGYTATFYRAGEYWTSTKTSPTASPDVLYFNKDYLVDLRSSYAATIDAAAAVRCEEAPPTYRVTVSAEGGVPASFSSVPSEAITATGADSGTPVSVTAPAVPSYVFSSWQVTDSQGSRSSTANPYSFNIAENTTLVAKYNLNLSWTVVAPVPVQVSSGLYSMAGFPVKIQSAEAFPTSVQFRVEHMRNGNVMRYTTIKSTSLIANSKQEVTVDVPPVDNDVNRDATIQWLNPHTNQWTTLVTYKQAGAVKTSFGHLVASGYATAGAANEPDMGVDSEPEAFNYWYRAVGLASKYDSFQNNSSANNHEYTLTGSTGCAAYYEGDENDQKTGKGRWFLPWSNEAWNIFEQVATINTRVGNNTHGDKIDTSSHRLWASDVYSGEPYEVDMINGSGIITKRTVDKDHSASMDYPYAWEVQSYARCVRLDN